MKLMLKWPHEETPLTEQQKQVYRYLLYQAMLDIRMLCQSRSAETWNPLQWRSQYRRSRTAGAIADWLHNLAKYSACDFRGFSAEAIWQEYDGLCQRFEQFGPNGFHNYRQRYEEQMARLSAD